VKRLDKTIEEIGQWRIYFRDLGICSSVSVRVLINCLRLVNFYLFFLIRVSEVLICWKEPKFPLGGKSKKHCNGWLNCRKILKLSQNIATVDLTVAYTVTKFQNLAHCNGFGQMVAMQVSQSDNFLVVNDYIKSNGETSFCTIGCMTWCLIVML
jgi:hypothetical protein